jgi:alanyl-tRNA synthetase
MKTVNITDIWPKKEDYITRVIRIEEENFAKTIDGGMKIVSDLIDGHKARGESVFTVADAFKLYDTYGFPVDLTEEIITEAAFRLTDRASMVS